MKAPPLSSLPTIHSKVSLNTTPSATGKPNQVRMMRRRGSTCHRATGRLVFDEVGQRLRTSAIPNPLSAGHDPLSQWTSPLPACGMDFPPTCFGSSVLDFVQLAAAHKRGSRILSVS